MGGLVFGPDELAGTTAGMLNAMEAATGAAMVVSVTTGSCNATDALRSPATPQQQGASNLSEAGATHSE